MTTKITLKSLWLIVCLISLNLINAQIITKESNEKKEVNFFDFVAQKRAKIALLRASKETLTKAEEKEIKQFERWVYAWKDKVNSDGTFPSEYNFIDYKNEILKTAHRANQQSKSSTVVWTQIGPVDNPTINGYAAYPGKGRVNVVAEDPTNNQIIYAGTAAGGIWKTINGGTTWSPKSDNLAGLGVSDILVDSTNPSTVYMATGDEDASHISSIGLFKSTDGGETWNVTGLSFSLSDNEYINDIAFAPGTSNTGIYALTNNYIKKSTDGGVTWSNAVNSPNYNGERFQTIVFDPNNANRIIVSDAWGGIWFSTDGGNNFIEHSTLQGASFNKLKLTTSLDDSLYFYGISQNGEFRKYRFAIDNSSADLVSTTPISGFNPQGGYNMCIAVSPTDKNKIMIGGVRGYKSTDGGSTFSVLLNPYNNPPGVGFYVHPDHHHLSFLSDGDTVLVGHDGGVHRGSFSGTPTWTDLSPGLIITQPYNIAITQSSNGDDFIMANQDNDGFSKVEKDGTRQWVSALAGDGTSAGIDYNSPNIRYLGGTTGTLYRSNDGYASSYNSAVQILSGASGAAFVSPMQVHPTTPTTIYAADNDIKMSTDSGDNFVSLNSGLTTIDFIDVTTNGASARIYVISESGSAKRSDDNGTTWVDVTPPSGEIFNSFSAMPNSNIVYATVKGYNSGNKVYKSTNNGATWSNMSGNLPNIIMKKIKVKVDNANETLFLGTELGVFWRTNAMTNWEKLGANLPNVIISDLKINYTDQLLFIGTFGRGMWRIDVSAQTLGIDDASFADAIEMEVYPNPVRNNNFNIKIAPEMINAGLTYTVYNYVGGIIKEGDINNRIVSVTTNEMASGMYLVKVSNGESSIVKKLIIR